MLPGQRVNLTLMDFGRISSNTSSEAGHSKNFPHCTVYAIIKETRSQKSMTVCGATSSSERERNIYVSEGNEIEVRMVTSQKVKEGGHFLIKFDGQ